MQKLQESETRDRFNMFQKRPIPASFFRPGSGKMFSGRCVLLNVLYIIMLHMLRIYMYHHLSRCCLRKIELVAKIC